MKYIRLSWQILLVVLVMLVTVASIGTVSGLLLSASPRYASTRGKQGKRLQFPAQNSFAKHEDSLSSVYLPI